MNLRGWDHLLEVLAPHSFDARGQGGGAMVFARAG